MPMLYGLSPGNITSCLNWPQLRSSIYKTPGRDGTVIAQKALSTIIRLQKEMEAVLVSFET
jgi:hypothetical protein